MNILVKVVIIEQRTLTEKDLWTGLRSGGGKGGFMNSLKFYALG